jgi:hypothetical protein
MKYSWELVADGVLDARKSAQALLWFDNIMRFFLIKEEPIFSEMTINIPVKIKKWSREVIVPDLIEQYFTIESAFYTVMTIGWWAYIKSIGETAWKDGFLETWPAKDIKRLFQWAFIAIQRVIKIIKHVGWFQRDVRSIPIFHNEKPYVQVFDNNSSILLVPKKYYEIYLDCPSTLFNLNADLVNEKTELSFSVFENSEEQKEIISVEDKDQFIEDVNWENEDNIVLPELEHWRYIELDWEISRISERHNNLWFSYMWHTITIKPRNWSLINFKNVIIAESNQHLFPRVKVKWIIDRIDMHGNIKKKKPEIVFTEVISLERGDNRLF